MSKLSILYVGINYQYFNQTNSCLIKLIDHYCEVDYYGPGYVDQAILENGLSNFAKKTKDYDLIIASKDIIYTSSNSNINIWIKKNTIHSSDVFLSKPIQLDICNFLEENKYKVVMSLLDVDLYSIGAPFFKDISKRASFYIGFGNNAFRTNDTRLYLEPFIQKKIKSNHIIGKNYFNFVKDRGNKIISFGHLVDDNEITFKHISNRKFDATVPGVHYLRRKEAYNEIKKIKSIKVQKEKKIIKKLLYKFPKNEFLTKVFMEHYTKSFKHQLINSKSCITDGGIIDLTIRKFLEIPAAGSLLICWPTKDLIDMGFENEKNAIFIESAKDLNGLYKHLKQNKEWWQRLSSEGQNLVIENHTISSRSKSLIQNFENIINSNYMSLK